MRAITLLAAVLALLFPSALRAESFRVERSGEGAVRVLARVLGDAPAPASAERLAASAPAAARVARAFLEERASLFGLAGVALEASEPRASAGALHVRFTTRVDDPTSSAHALPIFGGEITVHESSAGEVILVTNDARGARLEAESAASGPVATADAAVARAIAATGAGTPFRFEPRASAVAARTASGFRRAWQVEIAPEEPPTDWLVVVGEEDGAILFRTNRILNAHAAAPAETTGHALVFDPHPIAASGDPLLEDWNDVDEYRAERPMFGLDSSGYLRGPYVDAFRTMPTAVRAQRPDHIYEYSRTDDNFAEVNVYYHLDRYQRLLQGYGFTDANNRRLPANAHGASEDNSYYQFGGGGLLIFGNGGVDDAEDAEIILHEYGHAIHHNIVPGLAASPANANVRALSEGWGDYIAASDGGDACVGEWDASTYSDSIPPCLRRTDNPLVYPRDWRNEIHDDGEIWSSALWAVRGALGRTIGDRLAVQAYYFTSGTSTFPDAGWAVVLADWTLYDGDHRAVIESILSERGLLPSGEELLLADDATTKIGIGFPFTFASATYDSLFVSSNGSLTFDAPDPSPAASAGSLAAGPPRVALFWTDLDPTLTPVRVERFSGGITVSYDSVAVAGAAAPLSASVTLFEDAGEMQMTFASAPAAAALVGIAAGGGASPTAGNFESLPIGAAPAAGIYEMFAASPDADFALAGHSLRFTPLMDGTYLVSDPELETAVAVTHFEAVGERGAVVLRFGLPAGHSVVGFRVERAEGDAAGAYLGGLRDASEGENTVTDTNARPGVTYRYWIHLVERSGETTVIGPISASAHPPEPRLLAPNPFRPGQSFRVEGAGAGEASVAIFDVRGRRVRELRERGAANGSMEIVWRGEDDRGHALSSGIYFVRLRGESGTLRRRILLMR